MRQLVLIKGETCMHITNSNMRNKDDRSLGFKSHHFITIDQRMHIMLSLLFKAILHHGHSPGELITSTIVSIPKDVKATLSNRDNYYVNFSM